MKYGITLLIAACLLMPARFVRGEDAAKPKDEIEKLIDQLGADEYANREDAAKKLKAIGKPALPALKQAATDSDDAEVVSRCQALIKRIEVRPIPQPDPALGGGNGLAATRLRMRVENDNKIMEVTEGGRELKLVDGPEGISLTVTGLVDGKPGTEEYTAKDTEQLKTDNPEAYALFERWAGGRGPGFMFRGPMQINGQVQINGALLQPMPIVPDELEQLRSHLEKQLKDSKLTADQLAEVRRGVDDLVETRNGGVGVAMEKYTQQCDDFRKVLEQYKLTPGEFLPPPAKTRLGVSVSSDTGHLVVQRIAEKSRAERIGLRVGDEIKKIEGKEVANIADLRKAVGAKEKGLMMEITRDGDDMKLEEKEEKPAK